MEFLYTYFQFFFGNSYLSLFGEEFKIVLTSLKILSLNVGAALLINLWVHKQYVYSKYNQILLFQFSTIIINILLNYYLISMLGVNGAALATALSAIISFILINIAQPKEFFVIFSSFSVTRQKQMANAILKIIFVKRNPENKESIKD